MILRLERRSEFSSFKALVQNIKDDRPRLFGEYLWYLNRIIAVIREHGDALLSQDETHRMADFAALARVIGRVLDWPEGTVDDLMLALQGERDAFINEEDPLLDVLEKWIAYRPRGGVGNVGREINVTQLATELDTLAQAMQIPWKHTQRTIAQKIRSPHIERVFHVESLSQGGHRAFRLWRHTDAKLEVIDGDPAIPEVQ